MSGEIPFQHNSRFAPRSTPLFNRRRFIGGISAAGAMAVGGFGPARASAWASSRIHAAEPQPGGSLRVALAEGVPDDLYLGNSFGVQLITWLQFAWPLYLGSATGFEFEPGLAEGYEATEDGLTHTFTLRPDLTFHDGSPIDAEAVVQNLGSYFFEDHPLRDDGAYVMTFTGFGFPPAVDRVEAMDELSLRIVLTEPKLELFGDPLYQFPIMNPAVLAQPNYGVDAGALRDGGSGPFRVTAFEPGAFVELERFDGFFEEVYLDQLRIDLVPDASATALALRGGEVDVAIGLMQADFDSLANDPSFQPIVISDPGANVFMWFFTPKKPELEDVRVREAIWLAMNREAYREAFFIAGMAFPSTQPAVLEGTRGFNPDLEERPYDPERAMELLAEAGVENLRITTLTTEAIGPVTALKQIWEAVVADLAAVGIEMDVTIADQATVDAEQSTHDVAITFFDGIGPFLLYQIFFIGLGDLYEPPDPRAVDPRVKELFTAAKAATDIEEQNRLLHELMALNHNELMMGIPIAQVAQSGIARQQVRDYRLSPLSNDPQHKTWIEQ